MVDCSNGISYLHNNEVGSLRGLTSLCVVYMFMIIRLVGATTICK